MYFAWILGAMRKAPLIVLVFLFLGCAIRFSKREEEPVYAISAPEMTCEEPYRLERDCSERSGPTRAIEINEVPMKVAGSSDGRAVLVMPMDGLLRWGAKAGPIRVGAQAAGDVWEDDVRHMSHESTKAAFELKSYLKSRGVRVQREIPIVFAGEHVGYVLELERDGFSLLTKDGS